MTVFEKFYSKTSWMVGAILNILITSYNVITKAKMKDN